MKLKSWTNWVYNLGNNTMTIPTSEVGSRQIVELEIILLGQVGII